MALPTEKTSAVTFVREGSPPGGTVASPGPQYWSPDNTQWELVQGEDGAIYVIVAGITGGGDHQEVRVDDAGRVLVRVTDGVEDLVLNSDGSLNTRISDGTDDLEINADGSLNVRVGDGTEDLEINADGSITTKITDGTEELAINSDGSLNTRGDETIVRDSDTNTDTINSFATQTFTIAPTAGTMAELITWSYGMVAPGGAASGNHAILMQIGADDFNACWWSWNFDENMNVVGGIPDEDAVVVGPETGKPGVYDAAAMRDQTKSVFFSSAEPLRLLYKNLTDVNNTNNNFFFATYIERKVT